MKKIQHLILLLLIPIAIGCDDDKTPTGPDLSFELGASISGSWNPVGVDPETGLSRDCQLTAQSTTSGGKTPYRYQWGAPWTSFQGFFVSEFASNSILITMPSDFGNGGLQQLVLEVVDNEGKRDSATVNIRIDCTAEAGASFQGR